MKANDSGGPVKVSAGKHELHMLFHKVPAAFDANSMQCPGGKWCFQSIAAIVNLQIGSNELLCVSDWGTSIKAILNIVSLYNLAKFQTSVSHDIQFENTIQLICISTSKFTLNVLNASCF